MMQSISTHFSFQPIMQTNKWCYMVSQNSGNVQISDVLLEFLFDQKN